MLVALVPACPGEYQICFVEAARIWIRSADTNSHAGANAVSFVL